MLRVAIQGYAASFHDVAAHKLLGDAIAIMPCDTFAGVFDAVLNNQAEYGVVAVENTMYGPITTSNALFKQHTVTQLKEVSVRVEQCLLALPGVKLEDISDVYSHPVALVQCDDFLHAKLPQAMRHEHADTAGAAADVARSVNVHAAAIASRAAADVYGLNVLACNIASEAKNYTRFILFCKPQQ